MGLLEAFTGGKSDSATDALKRAEAYFTSVKTPTKAELTLPELQKYVEAGIMTPAQAQAYLQDSNAFADENIDQTGTGAQMAALNKLSAISDAGPEGTPMQQAQMEQSLEGMRTADAGSIGAIEQQMAARGTPRALIQAAMASQVHGQNAQQAHLDAVNAQAAAYQNALSALSQQGGVGNALQGQQNTQANTVAGAANAMQQFNAQNQQNMANANANRTQDANTMNAANRQQVSNNNVGLGNARTQANAQIPQQLFQNDMSKASGMAGAATNIGNLYQQQGQQNAGITAGLINLGTSFIPKPAGASASGMGSGQTGTAQAGGSAVNTYQPSWNQMGYANGGIVDQDDPMNCADGAMIPGDADFPGDSPANDTVPIMASPGEAVIPRSQVEQNPDVVSSLLDGDDTGGSVDAMDVATVLKALRSLRMGVA